MRLSKAPHTLELLAPARDADTAIAAIDAGADAVYLGAQSHGARRAAANSPQEIAAVCDHAHRFRARVYATVNTLVYDSEIPAVERMVADLYRAGVDALIVQDLGLLRMDLPPIDLHASTQCDIRTPQRAQFLASLGFSRLVLPRELSLDEIREMRAALPADVELEAFVHGALCVSYSGDCRASLAACGRSANRGECAQICRLPFSLVDGKGRILLRDKHLLSLRDLNRLSSLREMADAGVCSFKIEGRLKDTAYVRNVVGAYSRRLDALVAEHPELYARASVGTTRLGFTPAVEKSFNRGFTSYFLSGSAPKGGIASLDTPKSVGESIGTVVKCDGGVITARLTATLANGDGLGYFTPAGIFRGFRLNRVDGNRLYPASPQSIPEGTKLLRNRSKEWDDIVAAARSQRTVGVDMNLRLTSAGVLVLELSDERGCSASATIVPPSPLSEAVTPQRAPRRRILEKLGGTGLHPRKIVDLVDHLFIPASLLAELRRAAVDALERTARATYPRPLRRPEDLSAPGPVEVGVPLNVANRLAHALYADHGAETILPAAELALDPAAGTPATADRDAWKEAPVMTTRYCLRRELGKCLLTPAGRDWPRDLALVSDGGLRFRLDFDCANCRMRLYPG